ncbi:MAG: hypothetical protein ACI4DY_13440 [Monoglobaceae bacterium]
MYYLMITISAMIFSVQFMFNEKYQKAEGNGWDSALRFSLYSSAAGFAALLAINRFSLEISLFSAVVAVVYSIVVIALNYSTVKAFDYANVSVYSVFSMIGGMLLPFMYGVVCGEEFKITRMACCLLILLAVLMNIDRGDNSMRAFKYYMAVFVLNGMVGVLSKFHQSNAELCTDSASFLMLTKIITAAMSAALIAVGRHKSFKVGGTALAYASGGAILNSAANLLLLIALIKLPASVQYPIVTGGVIVFSCLIDLFQRTKISKRQFASAAVALLASVIMAF